ncbi:MAG: aldo/keto reductase [Bacteroidetes bacterium]|nr:aldo/keto reductase [Bacteroidota bacterium]
MKINITKDLKLSRIIHGHWRLADWDLSAQELLKLTEQLIELGITTFDHADIYGNHTCESLFGEALKLKKGLREKIQIITKCGIKLNTDKFPNRDIKYYDYSYDHIINSVNTSLQNLNTDYIDILLLHRPAPFFNPEEVALVFSHLELSGKVLYCGVSNFTPSQYEMLNAYTDERLVTNQVEISPLCLENFENGNIDFFLKEKIKPMAWSPMAGGKLFNPTNEHEINVFEILSEIAQEHNTESIAKIAYAWLLNHPVGILPIVGSQKLNRIKEAVEALEIKLTTEQWYKIYSSAIGSEVP